MTTLESHIRAEDIEMLARWRAHRTGLAPYYPILYALVIGMGAQRVFEFGTGESTLVLLDALKATGGHLVGCSPDATTMTGDGRADIGRFTGYAMTSAEALARLGPEDVFDLVLHDGSHSADVVAADLEAILPRVRKGGLVLIHDTFHSYVGEQMLDGLARRGDGRSGQMPETERITFPFAFGLTVLQVWGNDHLGPVSLGPEKATSTHRTLRTTEV